MSEGVDWKSDVRNLILELERRFKNEIKYKNKR